MMKSALDRRLGAFAEKRPDAMRLALVASLAVRVEPPLLRRLRTELLPDVDVGAEADLWFSPFVESRGVDAIVLQSEIAGRLRTTLAQTRPLLERAATVMRDAHIQAPALIRLEERLTTLALRDGSAALDEIDAALRPLLAVVRAGDAVAKETAHWALRALPRAPAEVRNGSAALALALSASTLLGRRVVRQMPSDGVDLGTLAWAVPPSMLANTVKLGVTLQRTGVRFEKDGFGSHSIELSATNPLVVEIEWQGRTGRHAMLVEVEPGRTVNLGESVTQVKLRTLSAVEYTLERATKTVRDKTTQSIAAGGASIPEVKRRVKDRDKPASEKEATKVGGFEYDVFVSYGLSDRKWVEQFAPHFVDKLTEHLGRDARVFVDFTSLHSGTSWEFGARQALESAATFLIVEPFSEQEFYPKERELIAKQNRPGDVFHLGRERLRRRRGPAPVGPSQEADEWTALGDPKGYGIDRSLYRGDREYEQTLARLASDIARKVIEAHAAKAKADTRPEERHTPEANQLLVIANWSSSEDEGFKGQTIRQLAENLRLQLVVINDWNVSPHLIAGIVEAEAVIVDMDGATPFSAYMLGVAHALRRGGATELSRSPGTPFSAPSSASSQIWQEMTKPPSSAFLAELEERIRRQRGTAGMSPVYQALPDLSPPRRGAPRRPAGAEDPFYVQGSPDCLVLSGFRKKYDPRSRRLLDHDAMFRLIVRPAAADLGLKCMQWDYVDPMHTTLFSYLWGAKIVIADLSTLNETVLYQLGMRHGLRSHGTLLISATGTPLEQMPQFRMALQYEPLGENIEGIGEEQAQRSRRWLSEIMRLSLESSEVDSPVYQGIDLIPPYIDHGAVRPAPP